jgi:hypothetical protein
VLVALTVVDEEVYPVAVAVSVALPTPSPE